MCKRKLLAKKVFIFTLALFMLLFATACGKTETAEKGQKEEQSGEDAVAQLMEQMSTEEKVGQLIIGRCPGEDAAEEMSKYLLGGYTFYKRDFNHRDGSWLSKAEVKELLDGCSEDMTVAPIFAVDEEGGTVTRLSENPDYFPNGNSKAPREIVAKDGIEGLEKDSREKSEILKNMGFHVNFAPVADLTTDENACMYSRSLGDDPEEVSKGVTTMVKAMNEVGIGPVLKHFPGYGNNEDTHLGMVQDTRPYEEFKEKDYKPFQAGIDAGCEAVMMEHTRVEAMDAERPASLSPKVISELRDTLGFEGVIMTDDLAMGEMTEVDRDGHVAIEAILAGNDMVISSYYRASYDSLLSAVESGEITKERLDESVKRILTWKDHLNVI